MSANDRNSDDSEKKPRPSEKGPERRKVLKGGVVIGGAVVGSALTLPKKWTRPIVDAVIVPAHAAVSPGAPTPSPSPSPTPSPSPSPTLVPSPAPPSPAPTAGP